MGVFKIKADEFEWIGGAADDPQDLCLHGHVMVQFGDTVLEDTGTVSATALYLLKTLTEDKVMAYHDIQMIPCCGHSLFANKELTNVMISGCDKGTDWSTIHEGNVVFFVHKDNPIDNLTTEQIKGIYSEEITNWKQVGGKNEEIAAFQRNEGSGSQSMLERFMGDTPIMEAPTEMVNTMMSGIIEQVSNYRSKSNSIGFSFRYYVEGIIQNPDIKVLSVDGIAPTAENIKNGTYPIVTPMYAVTYEENTNENVDKLLQWILSEEGQYIIEETGYVGISD